LALAGSPAAADAISTHGDVEAAVEEVGSALEEKIGRGPDLLLIYLSAEHRDAAGLVLRRLQRRLAPDVVAGCTVSGAVGGGRELQSGPCLSAFAARLPGTRVQAFHLRHDEEAAVVHGWPDVGTDASILLFPDPFTFPIEPFLESLRTQRAELPAVVGGLASGANRAGGNVLFTDDGIFEHGAAGVVLRGSVRLAPLVSQGCRPVGPVLQVTRSERNIVYELGGKPAYEGLAEMLSDLEEDERRRFMRAPHVGLRPLTSSSGEEARDFLVRGVTGVDPEQGAIALAESVQDGSILQFQARDREAAHKELESLLDMASSFHARPFGALLFPCTGRGLHLFQQADHDIAAIHRHWEGLPVSGFFAAGEIGPVCGKPYVHGLSASLALLVAEA
jgi:small ligand-binding sensory domain FIST